MNEQMSRRTPEFEIVTLKSGIKSLRQIENHETFHPGIGPIAEATLLHVRQQRLKERCAQSGKFVIWDVGLGAGANVVAAIESLVGCEAQVEIHSFDQTLAPIEFALENSSSLDYLLPHHEKIKALLSEKTVHLHSKMEWHLHLGDFREQMMKAEIPSPHSVFYDPYSPKRNMEMWTLEHFTRLRNRLSDHSPCLLTNYTRSSVVRVTWLLSGFFVGVGTIIGEKEETSVASNRFELLERPLKREWLERVKVSHNAAPLRGTCYSVQPINPDDFESLKNSPQFHPANE